MQKINEKAWAFLDPATIEPQALTQINNISEMPFVFKHLAVMPDCHLGKGATVGSVIPTMKAIIPAAVGVDIGCGMIAVKTPFFRKDLTDLKKVRLGIEQRVPLSAGARNGKIQPTAQVRIDYLKSIAKKDYSKIDSSWELQLGTLGSGNHFIEVVVDENDQLWAFLHSGSRGIGNQIAKRHIEIAQKQMELYHIQLKDKDLAYLSEGTPEFDEYIQDLKWAQAFALENRNEMMDRTLMELADSLLGDWSRYKELELERVQCHHNFTQMENHFGKNVWISRKGAIDAHEGVLGLIPGSMGTASYVVRGRGNPMSFCTAPHGAGRNFSRSEARRRFTMEDFDRLMTGIEVKRSKEFIDEIPLAYKDIDVVMKNAEPLVEIVHTFKQIVNVKGN